MPFLPNNLFGPHYDPPPHHNHYIGKPKQDPLMHYLQIPGEASPIVLNAIIEWKETPTTHVYKAHLHGLRQSEVRVEVENDRELCIIGEKRVERETRYIGRGQFVERVTGGFIQRLMLPENSNVHRTMAYMDNGELIISVPKY